MVREKALLFIFHYLKKATTTNIYIFKHYTIYLWVFSPWTHTQKLICLLELVSRVFKSTQQIQLLYIVPIPTKTSQSEDNHSK